ncbi:MAG: opacity protein-like surface antigen [Patiriisocius sp.]|jgi:opacity protein-like surface antigen
MKIRITLILCFSLLGSSFFAQKNAHTFYPEIGIMGGVSYYIGDINPYRHFGSEMAFGYAGVYRANITRRHVIRVQASKFKVQAHDNQNKDASLVNRNLHFRSDITEFAILLEINFHSFRIGDKYEVLTPYVFGGVAQFTMDPEAEIDGSWFELQTLHTEGQTIGGNEGEYKRSQFALPFGVGVKYAFAERLALSLEWGMRKTSTDYLDDVSGFYGDPGEIRESSGELGAALSDRSLETVGPNGTNNGVYRGNPDNNDWYIYSGLMLSVRLGKNYTSCWRGDKSAKKY